MTRTSDPSRIPRLPILHKLLPAILVAVSVLGLGYYYFAAATEHANTVNTFKARGDQSAYLAEAKLIYDNWRGVNEPPIVQPRNRMPLYPAYLAARYDPRWSDQEFFEHAKRHNIELSLVLLAIVALVLTRHLPSLAAANLTLVVAFGYFVFKAGYVQSELLFYTLHFLTFVAMWKLLESRTAWPTAIYGVLAGALAALAHLTKAAMLPLAVILLAVCAGDGIIRFSRTRQLAPVVRGLGGALLFAATFLVVLYPYISTSKRVHGQYFYNLNTSALIWYDNYPLASVAILSYGPDGWPSGRRSERPGPVKYWREHTVGQILERFENGFRDMAVRSYRTFWYFKYVAMYALTALLLMALARRESVSILKRHLALIAFVVLYAAVYIPAVAFYEPISGTGTTRFLLTHAAPFLFLLSLYFASPSLESRRWRVAGAEIGLPHLQLAILATIGMDLAFTVWPRLMTTYGGF